MSTGTVSLVLFFALVFVIHVGYGSVTEFDTGYDAADAYRANLTGASTSEGLERNLINEIISPAILGAVVVTLGIRIISGSGTMAVAAGFIVFFSNLWLIPINTISAMGIPYPLDWFFVGFMNLLLLISIAGFVRGVEP